MVGRGREVRTEDGRWGLGERERVSERQANRRLKQNEEPGGGGKQKGLFSI